MCNYIFTYLSTVIFLLVKLIWRYRRDLRDYCTQFYSYLYYLFYELLSPFIELLGILVTCIAYMFGLLNFKYMVIFFLAYALFGAMLTVISFLARNFLSDIRIGLGDAVKAFLLCIPENIFLRFLLAWTRFFSILFYRGKKTNWGAIPRQQISYGSNLR